MPERKLLRRAPENNCSLSTPFAQQAWQLRNVARYASSFIKRQSISDVSIALVGMVVHVGLASMTLVRHSAKISRKAQCKAAQTNPKPRRKT